MISRAGLKALMIPGFKQHREQFVAFTRRFLRGSTELDAAFQLKIDHTLRVVSHSLRFTVGLPHPIRFSAALSALYHDIGRFPQYQEYKTFNDGASLNHAFRSVEELESGGLLPPTVPFRHELIESIRLHNQKALSKPLPKRSAFFYHLLRDCDKADVLSVLKGHYQSAGDRDRYLTLGLSDEAVLSPQVIGAFRDRHIVDFNMLRTIHDYKLLQISWIFDIHFSETYRFLLDRNDFLDILATIPVQLLPERFAEDFSDLLERESFKKQTVQEAARAASLL